MSNAGKKIPMNVRLPSDLAEAIKHQALVEKRRYNEAVEQAIREYLNRHGGELN